MATKKPILSKDDLRDVLECPICFYIPSNGPIHQCLNGHTVCNTCFQNLEGICPVCREEIALRSLVSEKLLDKYVIQDFGFTAFD